MQFDWGEVTAIVATIIAGGSVWIALVANGHSAAANREAAVANSRASQALALQKEIDDRAREFRDVEWTGTWVPEADMNVPQFRLSNIGLTTAESVTLILTVPSNERQHWSLGTIEPGDYRDIEFGAAVAAGAVAALMAHRLLPFAVHWSSPRGQAAQSSKPGVPWA